jgi:hypothetical protein
LNFPARLFAASFADSPHGANATKRNSAENAAQNSFFMTVELLDGS